MYNFLICDDQPDIVNALKIYLARYGTLQEAITRIEEDRKADGGLLYLEFARKVNQHQKVMSLWTT